MRNGKKQNKQRSKRGALGSLILLVGVIIAFMFACIAVDIAHFQSASTEMQSVVDAAALMGCYNLQWSSSAANMTQAKTDAIYMVQPGSADLYSPTGINIPSGSVKLPSPHSMVALITPARSQ